MLSYPKAEEKWVEHTSRLIPIEKLRWTETAQDMKVSGQIRQLNLPTLIQREKDVRATPLTRWAKITVVPVDPQGPGRSPCFL